MERLSYTKNQFCSQTRKAQDWLTNNSINYRIVGGLGVRSYTAQLVDDPKTTLLKSNRSDVDLLISRSDYPRVKEYILGGSIKPGNGLRLDLTASKYIDYRPDDRFSFLVFRDIRMPILSDLFEVRENHLDGIRIETISAATLFHMFSVCGGTLRPKDWEQLLLLGRYLRKVPDIKFNEDDYQNFHTFLDLRANRYSLDIALLSRTQILLSYLPPHFDSIAWRIRGRLLKSIFNNL